MSKVFARIRMLRSYIFSAASVFLVGALMGAFLTDLPDAMMQPLFDLARQLRGQSWGTVTVFILCKNALAALVAILGGFLLGILPFAAALINGMVLGRVLVLQPAAVWLVLPHGVFEIAAVTTAWGIGLWCAGWLRRPPRWERMRQRAAVGMALYFKLILPLLALAAVIEATGIIFLTSA